jgi:hypothetical protein
MNLPQRTIDYIIDFLSGLSISESGVIYYGPVKNVSEKTKIIIIPAKVDNTSDSLPDVPIKKIDEIPILYGEPRIERQNGRLICHADIIASSFFLLSRYEEILKPECRDQHGRFCARDSIVFQQGYGNRPIVDEYGVLLRKWLREASVAIPPEKKGFSKIYLTHDVDVPFRFERISVVCKQYIKNILHYSYSKYPLKKFMYEQSDEYYTFPKIINYDREMQEKVPHVPVESIYFLISAGSFFNRKYYNFFSNKTKRLINLLRKSGAQLGFHVSYEAGVNPRKIIHESARLKKRLGIEKIISRHHYLQWREPEDVVYMEQACITDDFTLAYADAVGFRVGTCHPYRFINPKTKELTNVTIHPLEIMECTLDRAEYMNLDYEQALETCRKIVIQVYKHNGELVLLWHNTEFLNLNYQEKLYKSILNFIVDLYT